MPTKTPPKLLESYREVAPLPALTGVVELPGPVDTVVVALLVDPPPVPVVAVLDDEFEVEKTLM